jgi:Peptidase family S41/N-terminal domain of Peptidase_S41 in eukaryotic IRBP
MSEKIYALLLRLFPSHFREAYGEAALQLFRDRARDEKGFLPRLRLWLDLLGDLAVSVPREYRHVQEALLAASAQPRLEGAPSLFILEEESPRPRALFFGGVLTFLALAGFSIGINQAGSYAGKVTMWSGQPAPRAASSTPSVARSSPFESSWRSLLERFGISPPQAWQPTKPPDATRAMNGAPGEAMKLDAAERQLVIDGAVANLKAHYVDPDVAQKVAEALRAHQKNGDDNVAADGNAFADLLTRQMRDVSHDMHLMMVYSEVKIPDRRPEPTPEEFARYRKAMEQDNCTFETVKILPHNIGYLKLNSFPEPSLCQSTAVAAMASLNQADALIFDLRDNTGGYPKMVALIAAYLFDHPEYWYNPREETTRQSWTASPVPGNKLADKPVYVLTSISTFSGAEQFSYDLKMLKRATLVGETTGGGAHAGVFHRIDDHFGMGIPEVKAVNPFSTADWEGVGVEPDVKVQAADALETAEKLAESKLRKK